MATVPKESFRRWKEINKEDGHPIWGRWAAVVASALYPDENDLEKVRARVKRHFSLRDLSLNHKNREMLFAIAKLDQSPRAREYFCETYGIENPYPNEKVRISASLLEETWESLRALLCRELRVGFERFWQLHPVEDLAEVRCNPEHRIFIQSWESLVPDLYSHPTMLEAWKATWKTPEALSAVRERLEAKMQEPFDPSPYASISEEDELPSSYLEAVELSSFLGSMQSVLKNPRVAVHCATYKVAKELRKEQAAASAS